MITVSCTGHRPDKLGSYKVPNPIYNYVKSELGRILLELKPSKAISGMALGADQYFAEVCIELGIPFVAAVPFVGQERIWPQSSKDHYNELLKQSCEVVVVSEGGYSAQKMQIRNCWMTDHCNKLIGIFDSTPGGTANCLSYAEKIGREVIIIDPRKYNQ